MLEENPSMVKETVELSDMEKVKMMLKLVLMCCLARPGLGDNTLHFVRRSQEAPVSKNVSCPDQSRCPVGNTCCLVSDSSQFGCCPHKNAFCCADKMHCCPEGMTCDMPTGGCVKKGQGHFLSLFKHRLTRTKATHYDDKSVICPDDTQECPNGSTCCVLTTGQYGCCPLSNAVCCADMTHCCPTGYRCDTSNGACVRDGVSVPWVEKKAAIQKKVEDIDCYKDHECPDGDTSCLMADDQWGCCPVSEIKTDPVVCPGGVVGCPAGSSCSQLPSGAWGCCPFKQAMWCTDHIHCCPQHSTCSMTLQKCIVRDQVINWFERRPAMMLEKPTHSLEHTVPGPTAVVCPGGQTQCPDSSTCCELASGQYGCCPVPEAVCCSDMIHCCPWGYTCSSGSCVRDGVSLPWVEKKEAIQKKVEDIDCDKDHECPDGYTCCMMADDQWGCCPMPE